MKSQLLYQKPVYLPEKPVSAAYHAREGLLHLTPLLGASWGLQATRSEIDY
jgi:hypothetical protein